MSQITNREIAHNRTWIAAVTWLECPFCTYLSQDLELVGLAVPCPSCGNSGRPRLIFPGITGSRLLEMISHFYANSQDRHDDRAANLARELSNQLGREFDPKAAVGAASAVQLVRTKSDGSDVAFEHLLETIQERLELHSENEARRVFVPLLQYSDANEDHQIAALLVATLLEQMFKELLTRMSVCVTQDWDSSRKEVRDLRDQGARERMFAKLAKVSLNKLITSLGFSGFYIDWQAIRELRNKFIHGMPFIIGASDAEKAFELAKNSFRVFAFMHNKLCFFDGNVN